MAKSVDVIYMEFNRALEQADKLDQLAQKYRHLANNDFSGCISQIMREWESESATRFCMKGRNLQDQMIKRAQVLEIGAKTIRAIAKNTYDAEMLALKLARQGLL